jgi:hypothetical protein
MSLNWFSGPSTYKTPAAEDPFPKTSRMSYVDLANHLLELTDEIRHLNEALRSATADMKARRLQMIADGKELPGSATFSRLSTWGNQDRLEQLALQNREHDEATARQYPNFRLRT